MTAFVLGLPEHKVRVIAPDVGGGFGSKIYLYAEDAVVTWAVEAASAGRSSGPPSAASPSCPTRTAATTSRIAELAMDKDGKFLALRVHTTANIGRLPVDLRLLRADRSSTRRCSPASTRRRRSTAR